MTRKRTEKLQKYMDKKDRTLEEIGERFRRETSKLDRWIYQGDVREYFKLKDELADEKNIKLREAREEYGRGEH